MDFAIFNSGSVTAFKSFWNVREEFENKGFWKEMRSKGEEIWILRTKKLLGFVLSIEFEIFF